jgi:ubiquinone/menaquinone biosynthesis C-methylase UbiE
MAQKTLMTTRADYGLDAPTLVQKFMLAGGALVIVGLGMLIWGFNVQGSASNIIASIAIALLITGIGFLFSGTMMIWSSRSVKMHARDKLLDGLQLHGDETVLDLGCGRGLLLIGAAKRVPQGHAIGIDLWSQEDQGDNRKDATLANAHAEGVAERVEVRDGDMRELPFENASIDVVVANLSIHNIYNREGRRQAINETVRVLKPGGKVALMDFEHVKEYGEDLQAAAMQDVRVSQLTFWIFPPVRIATARKG